MYEHFKEDKMAMVLATLVALSLLASVLSVVAGFVAGATRNIALVGLLILAVKVTMELLKEGTDKITTADKFNGKGEL